MLKIWERWKRFARKIGNFQSRLLLSLFYSIVIFPLAPILKLFFDPLGIKKGDFPSYWLSRKRLDENLEDLRRQY